MIHRFYFMQRTKLSLFLCFICQRSNQRKEKPLTLIQGSRRNCVVLNWIGFSSTFSCFFLAGVCLDGGVGTIGQQRWRTVPSCYHQGSFQPLTCSFSLFSPSLSTSLTHSHSHTPTHTHSFSLSTCWCLTALAAIILSLNHDSSQFAHHAFARLPPVHQLLSVGFNFTWACSLFQRAPPACPLSAANFVKSELNRPWKGGTDGYILGGNYQPLPPYTHTEKKKQAKVLPSGQLTPQTRGWNLWQGARQ